MVEVLVLVVLVSLCILVEDILELPSLQSPPMFSDVFAPRTRCLPDAHIRSTVLLSLEDQEYQYPEYDQPGVPESTDLESSHREYTVPGRVERVHQGLRYRVSRC